MQLGASVTSQKVVTDGLIFSRGEAGSWDEAGVGSPVVRLLACDDNVLISIILNKWAHGASVTD